MSGWIYWAIVAIVAILAIAMQSRSPKQKRPSLEDVAIPRAKQGEPIPMVFGTITSTGSTVVWYGHLMVETETEDGVRTRKFHMGLHFIPCHGPIDHFLKIMAGDRDAWVGDVTESGTITIAAGDLFGGKRQGGGITGDVDLMFGEATQSTNSYLTSVQGTPQPAYRGVLSVVCNQTYVSANATHIEPWAFKVNRIFMGWQDDECWYPATAEIPRIVTENTELFDAITSLLPSIFLRFEEPLEGEILAMELDPPAWIPAIAIGQTCVNEGSGPDGEYIYNPSRVGPRIVPDGAQSWRPFLQANAAFDEEQAGIQFPYDAGHDYYLVRTFSIVLRFTADADFRDQTAHYLYHQGDTAQPDNQGLGLAIETDIADSNDVVIAQYWSVFLNAYVSAYVELPEDIEPGESYTLFCLVDLDDGVFGTGKLTVYWGCGGTFVGQVDFPDYPVPPTVSNYETYICSVRGAHSGFPAHAIGSYSLKGAVDEWCFFPHVLTGTDVGVLAPLFCLEGQGDMNPAHIIYQAITDNRGMGLPVAMIDDDSFRSAADTFYAEGLGLCLQWTQQEKVEDFIQHICDHAACILRMSHRTGKFQLKPLRGDYVASQLPVYDEEQITEIESWERIGYGELISEVTVTFRDSDTNKDGAATLQNLAVIQAQSGVVAESINLPGIPYLTLAQRVAMRELKARSIPFARCKIKTNRETWELLPGDVFKLSWAKLGLEEVIMRVITISTGSLTDGQITIEAAEDVFGMPNSTYAVTQGSGWVAPEIEEPEEGAVRYEEDGTTMRREEAGSIRIEE